MIRIHDIRIMLKAIWTKFIQHKEVSFAQETFESYSTADLKEYININAC